MDEERLRRRERRPDVIVKANARAVLGPIARKLSGWQPVIAFQAGVLQAASSSISERLSAADKLQATLDDVIETRRQFAEIPGNNLGSYHEDMGKALERVEQQLWSYVRSFPGR